MRVQDGDLEERPDADDVVVHVRLCDGPVHQYKYYSWKNYFSHVLPRLQPPPKRIKIVTACNPRRNGVVKDLLENVPNAEVAKPARFSGGREKWLRFRLYGTRQVKVTESTQLLGVSRDAAVHAPSAGVLPAPLAKKVSADVEAACWGLYNRRAARLSVWG